MTTADDLAAWTLANARARAAYHADTRCPDCGEGKTTSRRACDPCTEERIRATNRATKKRKKAARDARAERSTS